MSPASDIISTVRNIMPDLETPYSRARLPTTNHSAIELKDHSLSGPPSPNGSSRWMQFTTILRFRRSRFGTPDPVWDRLTNDNIEIYENTFFPLLKSCLDLSSLTIHVLSSDGAADQVLQPFTHTKLQFLCITTYMGTSKHQLSHLVKVLSLPNLRTLTLSGTEPWSHEELILLSGLREEV
ncbi:uncharacterized protein EDB91DRAFT_1339977 [Suillus paluster]|uniref:uncharacterized protein n=1 Tax=Suillus paluster TaxID=48578 RepID=UPI001B876091|nr:uncharacterized protein EDB91DRAFT_1339977 [Suillus paluster]KAG1725014.1 hypothetical protein EDB91DRAFT_1339977 [Suillus paluster]